MRNDLEQEVQEFVKSYAALFSSPRISSEDEVTDAAMEFGRCCRPGFTFFTNGKISRFEDQAEAARLVETEMRNNITSGIGTYLAFENLKMQVMSETSVLCWITWTFHPKAGSKFDGKSWTFTNLYGYRKDVVDSSKSGWEFVLRDEEPESMRRATGTTFL